MTDDQRDILRMALEQMEEKKGLVWGPEWMEEVAAALRALLAENAALKAQPDPLAEMWAALTEYQPQADSDGHGDTWRAMCAARTANAAWEAYHSVPSWNKSSCLWSSRAAADAARAANFGNSAKDAIAQIRRAKEAQP
jgi:hypothetical protein